MSDWEPQNYHKDPMVNAVLNVAEGLHRLADATDGLLYGIKYSKQQGMSLAEAIEVAGSKISEAMSLTGISESVISVSNAVSDAKEDIAGAIAAAHPEGG